MKIVREKIKKGPRKISMGDLLPIVLRRNEKKQTEEVVGDKQSFDPVQKVLAR